ncbi:MAG TPA: electron transport complex subunit RsxG [Xanthomonadales bacterium]|nr:electron transport complex subunit RsxG [Xanthomonadales bacterium]
MDSKQPGGSTGHAWRSALALGLVALIGTALLAGIQQLTRKRIEAQERRAVLAQLGQLVAADRYDNALHDDRFTFTDNRWFPGGREVTVYRARLHGEAVAAVLKLVAPGGYNGDIHMLVGINADGTLTGVRVTAHKETPGLGDALETARSHWILGFSGRSLSDPQPSGWAVRRDGGVFDQFTGATITPRAVVMAVRQALEYFSANKEMLFAQPAEPGNP